MLACTLVGCGKKECDVCGETASCKTTKIDGKKINYCKDCKDLVKGMKVDDVIERLNGIHCGKRSTSCPDQLSLALLEWKKENNC